jgi:hypothetical protein
MKSLGRSVGWTVVEDEGAAPEPASGETAPSIAEGGTDDRSTLADPDEFSRLFGENAHSQVPEGTNQAGGE